MRISGPCERYIQPVNLLVEAAADVLEHIVLLCHVFGHVVTLAMSGASSLTHRSQRTNDCGSSRSS